MSKAIIGFVFYFILLCFSGYVAFSQQDSAFASLSGNLDSLGYQKFNFRNGETHFYSKPRPFEFIRYVPRNMYEFTKYSVRRESLPYVGEIIISTAVLIAADQTITDATVQASNHLGIDRERKFKTAIGFKLGDMQVDALEIPDNLNTVFYFLGEGWPTLAIAGGMLAHGAIKKDYRSLRVASMIAESYVAMGLTVQFFKRITGRESPFVATRDGGEWKLFPNPKDYQAHVPQHDAFPSGHCATVMSTITILTGAYPEHAWIGPVGYSALGLICLSMINNEVHWISDYPLAMGIGYAYGKVVLARNRKVLVNKNRDRAFFKSSHISPVYYGNGITGLTARFGF